MTAPVLILAALSVIGGWIQFAPLWHPVSDWLEPVARPLAEPTNTQEALASLFAFLLGLAGLGVAWLIYSDRHFVVRRLALTQRVLERKFYFDELYDFAFYRPAVGFARLFKRAFEEPFVEGSIIGITETFRDLGFGAWRLQTGLVRTYALAIAASLAVITIVFVAVR